MADLSRGSTGSSSDCHGAAGLDVVRSLTVGDMVGAGLEDQMT